MDVLEWHRHKGQNPMPQHASTLLAVSYKGAVRLKERFWQDIHRSHFDISLKWVCENHAKELQASFVCPTIGHYSTHDSDILNATRTSEWDRWYVGEGKGPVEIMSWEKQSNGKVTTRHLADFNLVEEQPDFNWLTLYRESQTPQVEPVATCRTATRNKIHWQDPRLNRSQAEMEQAFDVERMAGDEEATTKRQKRQKRRYIGDSAFRLFTADVYQAGWANPFRFKSHLCCSTTSRHASLSPMLGELKKFPLTNPAHSHPDHKRQTRVQTTPGP